MKQLVILLVLWISGVAGALAQAGAVRVEISLDQDQYLASEDLRVAVKITNFSGQKLTLGQEPNWLTFTVDSPDRLTVAKIGEVPVATEFSIDSSQAATTRANIAPYFTLHRPGRYRVVAHVKLPQWQNEISSAPKSFSIATGRVLRRLEFGVPVEENKAGAVPEIRRYILQQAEYRKENRLYVRVTDVTETTTFRIFSVARMVSFNEPEVQIDRFSNLHVLNQTGQRSFNYCMINPDGRILVRQTHEFLGDSRPRLRPQEDGRVIVKGGVQRVSDTDLPPPNDEQGSIAPINVPTAAPTNATPAQP